MVFLFPRNPAYRAGRRNHTMSELFATPSDWLIAALFLLAVLASLGMVRLVERVKELRS